MYAIRCWCTSGLLAAMLLSPPAPARAQQTAGGAGIGVVTALQGHASVARQALHQPASLHFKDEVFFRDQITTQEKSTVRLLLGGKGVVTVREQSQVTLDESVAADGTRQNILGLLRGKIAAAVAHLLMRPGDVVEIQTPNAVAAVRGTALIAEYVPPQTSAEAGKPVLLASSAPGPFLAQAAGPSGGQSNFYVLSGSVTITPQGQPSVTLGPMQGLSVMATVAGVKPGPVQNLTPAQVAEAAKGLETGKPHTGEADGAKTALEQTEAASALTNAILQAGTGAAATTPAAATPSTPITAVAPVVAPSTTTTTATTVTSTSTNLVNNPGFETGDFTHWTATGAASVISDFGPGVFSPTAGTYMALLSTGAGAVNDTTSTIRQSIQSLSPGTVYLITFDYNFMSNEYPTQATTYNDTFNANLVDASGNTSLLASESRNSSTFHTDKPTISGGQSTISGSSFTLEAGNGYTGFKSTSKTVVVNTSSATLEYTVFDVGDTAVDSGVLIDKVSMTPDPPLYLLFNGQTLSRLGPSPLVEVSGQSRTFDSVLVSSGPPPAGNWSVSLGGPLLQARGANLTVPFSLFGLLDGSTLHTTSSLPLVSLEGGNASLSTIPGTAIFDFWGTEAALNPETGVPVGAGKLVDHAGPFLEASDGATVATQKVLKLDTAALEAAAPIIKLIGSTTAPTSLTSASATLDLIKSTVTSLGPLVSLDRGILNVVNGPLLNVTQGSYVNVTGDLLSLANQSRVNIVNGPLIAVAGAGSVLNVTGALANFSGTGGNTIIVKNSIAPTAVLTQPGVAGIGVSATGGGSISVGPNPVKGAGLGTISVTGSLIQAANAGAVKIGGR